MQTLTTAQAVVSMLEVNGIDTIFCLPGAGASGVLDRKRLARCLLCP